MIRSLAAIFGAVLLVSSAHAADLQPTFNCEIKDGGKTLRVTGANPTDAVKKCTIRCEFHTPDDKTVNIPCSATLDPKSAHKVLCEGTEPDRKVDYLAGMASKCS